MYPITFIHGADLHLDSPFQNLPTFDQQWIERLRASGWIAFERLIDLAIERQVDFVILAGDIFDQESRSIKAEMKFFKLLGRLSSQGIHSYILHGNHDPFIHNRSQIAEMAEGDPFIHIFSGEQVDVFIFQKQGVAAVQLYGRSFWQPHVYENLAAQYSACQRQQQVVAETLQIAVMHGVIDNQQGHVPYAPASLSEMRQSNFDYWALGHVHRRQVVQEQSPAIVYPGNIQGRHINERGSKGCNLVTINRQKSVDISFQPLETIRWEEVTVDCSSMNGEVAARFPFVIIEHLQAEMEQRYRVIDKPMLVRLILSGTSPYFHELRQTDVLEMLKDELENDRIKIVEIKNCLLPEVDIEQLRQQKTMLGEFLTLIDRARTDQELQEELRTQLQPLFESRKFQAVTETRPGQIGRGLWKGRTEQEEVLEWLAEVERLGIELLLKGEPY